VERSHRSDQEEFYQLLRYRDDVDLSRKLEEWERFYNYYRPHGAFKGKTPSEALKDLLHETGKCLTRSDISLLSLNPVLTVTTDAEHFPVPTGWIGRGMCTIKEH